MSLLASPSYLILLLLKMIPYAIKNRYQYFHNFILVTLISEKSVSPSYVEKNKIIFKTISERSEYPASIFIQKVILNLG